MNWQTKTLAELCVMYQPKTLSKKNFFNNGKYSVYGANGIIGKHNDFNHEKSELLLGCRGTCGSIQTSEPYSWINGNAMVIRPNENEVSKKYIQYYLKGIIDYKKIITGSSQPQITRESLNPVLVSYPSLEEQNRITTKLDVVFAKIDKIIENTKIEINEIKKIYESFLFKIFSKSNKNSKKKTLKEISLSFGRGKSKHRPRNDKKLFGDKIPFIQTGNIRQSGMYVSNFDKSYSEFGIKQSKIWKKDTVCITIAANIAELAILEMDACFPDSVIGVYPNKKLTNSKYLFYLLSFFQSYLKSKSKGSAQQNINLATFENEKFNFPEDLTIQNNIVFKLQDVQKNCFKFQDLKGKMINNLTSLKSSIINNSLQQKLHE